MGSFYQNISSITFVHMRKMNCVLLTVPVTTAFRHEELGLAMDGIDSPLITPSGGSFSVLVPLRVFAPPLHINDCVTIYKYENIYHVPAKNIILRVVDVTIVIHNFATNYELMYDRR